MKLWYSLSVFINIGVASGRAGRAFSLPIMIPERDISVRETIESLMALFCARKHHRLFVGHTARMLYLLRGVEPSARAGCLDLSLSVG